MKQINVRVGKKGDPITTMKSNARRPFTFYGEKFIVTNYISRNEYGEIFMMPGRNYIVTHYKTGMCISNLISSDYKESIDNLIEKTKKYLEERKDELKNVLKDIPEVN